MTSMARQLLRAEMTITEKRERRAELRTQLGILSRVRTSARILAESNQPPDEDGFFSRRGLWYVRFEGKVTKVSWLTPKDAKAQLVMLRRGLATITDNGELVYKTFTR